MYRLIRRYKLSVYTLRLSTVQSNLQKSNQICSYCSHHHVKKPVNYCSYGMFRHQSTNTNMAMKDETLKKKIKHKIKKYAEVLEVSGHSTLNNKAQIKKLSTASILKFAGQLESSLDQLHRIQAKDKLPNQLTSAMKIGPKDNQIGSEDSLPFDDENSLMMQMSANNLEKQTAVSENEVSLQEDILVLGASDETALIKNTSVLNTLQSYSENMDEKSLDLQTTKVGKEKNKKSKSTAKGNSKDEAAKVEHEKLKHHNKQQGLKYHLHAYLDVCINCGMTSQASSALVYYRNRRHKISNESTILDIALFNTVLHGLARSGNLTKIKDILEIISQDSIQPNSQTYAAVFECVGRMSQPQKHNGFLKTLVMKMRENQISLNDILDKSVFVNDQREMVEQGIWILKPDFKAVYTAPHTSHINHLLEKMTSNVGQPVTPAKGLFTLSELSEMGRRQMEIELNGGVTIKSVATYDEPTEKILHYRKKVIETEKMWKIIITEAFQRDMAILKTQYTRGLYSPKQINIYPFFKVLNEDLYVDVLLNEVKRLATGSETFSPSMSTLTRQLGQTVYNKYQIEIKKKHGVCDKISEIYDEYCDLYLNGNNGMNTRTTWQNVLHKVRHKGATADLIIVQWPLTVFEKIGRFLYNIIIRDIKFDINSIKMNVKSERFMPAFYTVFRHNRQYLTHEIKPHPALSRLYKESQLETLTFQTAMLPSISPPIPWYTIRNGGYMITDAKIIRLSYQATQQLRKFVSVPLQQLYPVLDSLNQLGSIPWEVNHSVLDIVLKVFQNGGSKKLDIPESPSAELSVAPIHVDATKEERNKAAKVRLKEARKKADMYSLWCDALYRLSLANHFKNQVFWLPHSMDFRGRVYPIPPHLNHLGSDMARSLMVFALGKPLGPNGLDWLKIHTINLTGIKKRESNEKRLEYANKMMPQILDSAENPITGGKWWQESEEPWQTLAACFEIANALKSPNPAEYVSKFPVHQDGSCNGLQHYAALGRDRQGAESVNLSPSAKPQDVYSSIAALVEKERKIDSEKGVLIAQMLDGLIKRKVIKQTVMTTVYGVTRFGARLQIARQLQEIDFPEQYLWQGSHYLANKTFLSLKEMFNSAKSIQDWLTDCARFITLVCAQHVEWVTPLGLPVTQPYNKNSRPMDRQASAQQYSLRQIPNVMKQKNAFPPNFVHSLDSSHMMLTSLHCEHAGLTFISVHDCFWTHACTIPQMNKICREQFVGLHSEPILQDLSRYLLQRFAFEESEINNDGTEGDLMKSRLNRVLKQVPKQGTFDLKLVLESEYFFS